MNPYKLTCYASPFPKVRIGKDGDGGYIVADIPDMNYDLLLAGGIDNDISFEEQFVTKHSNCKCVAYDGTITEAPAHNPRIKFVRKNIGAFSSPHTSDLHDLIETHENIFVKMDIEGHEIPWLYSLREEHMNKFEQIVMEFHNPFSDREDAVFDKINRTHYLVHFHPNNCCGTREHGGVVVPNIFECTYVHKRHFKTTPLLNTEPIPGPLDMKNTSNPDIFISHPPFVHPANI